MATTKQAQAAQGNVRKARQPATRKRTITQGAAAAQRKRTGGTVRKTRAELYEMARKRDVPGRSKMGRDELAKKLGER